LFFASRKPRGFRYYVNLTCLSPIGLTAWNDWYFNVCRTSYEDIIIETLSADISADFLLYVICYMYI
jgi:hypothetical protein